MRILFFCLTLPLLLTLSTCMGMSGRNRLAGETGGSVFDPADGVFEGTAQGYRGSIHVRLHIDRGIISEIEILDSMEDRFVGGAAIEELQELALIYNTADLDAISGATESSEGFISALSDALKKRY